MKLHSVRNIFALSVCLFLLTRMDASAAVHYTNGFESSWTNAPAGWTSSNNGAYWSSSTSTYFYSNSTLVTPHGGSYMAFFDGWNFSSGTSGTMISPTINLSAATQGRLGFWYALDTWGYGGGLTISISSDNGTTWTVLSTITSSTTTAWTQSYTAIPSAYWVSTFKVKFQGTSDYMDPICMDDLTIDDGTIPPVPLCGASATYNMYMGISNVTFNTINNTTTCTYNTNAFQDFTSLSTLTIAGLTYTLSVSGCGYDQYGVAYIDWNHNNVLGEVGETYEFANPTVGYLLSTGTPKTLNITVPTNVLPGPTIMRIRTSYSGSGIVPPPCGTVTYGETEDYTLNLVAGNNSITASPASLTFTAEQTGPLPASQSLSINTQTTQFAWTTALTQTPTWFTISPATGTGLTTVLTNIATTAINPQTYNGSITFNSSVSAPKVVNVTYNLIPRVQISPAMNPMTVKLGCTPGGTYSKTVQITNSGGHFANGIMMWTATAMTPDVTILTPSGSEGGNLSFSVNTNGMQAGNTYYRTIIINGYNSATNITASNGPYQLTVAIEFEPALPVSQTKDVATGTYTQYRNANNGLVAEVMANTTPITGLTLNMTPCTMPVGYTRLRYVRRIFQWACSSTTLSSMNVTARFYYTLGEAAPLVTNLNTLQVWQQPLTNGSWTLRGGSSVPNYSYVQATISTGLAGTFALAQPWFPKPMTLAVSTSYDRATRNVVLQWNTDIQVNSDGFVVERMKGDNAETGDWEMVGSVTPNASGRYGYAERVIEEGQYQYRIIAIDREGVDRESRPISVNVSNAPMEFALEQNYPNPFNPTTSIRYNVPQTVQVSVKVYDMMWREVSTLVNEVKPAGSYDVSFDASALPSGTYFYRMEAGTFSATKKMNLMK
jgi:hypothetical protein